MSTCLQHIFENPLPEKPTLLETLSWNQIKHVNSIDHSSSCTEIFGELHFKESPSPSPSSSSSSSDSSPLVCSSSFSEIIDPAKLIQNEVPDPSSNIDQTPLSPFFSSTTSATKATTNYAKSHKSSDSFSSLCYESLHLCTEGLGFESSDDVEDSKNNEMNECWETLEGEKETSKNHFSSGNSHGECRGRSRVNGVEYPPPIASIGRNGKPWVSFRSYRNNGRFVLEEIRVPTQDFLHAHREDGRLKLRFVQSEEEFLEEEEEQEELEEDYDGVEITDMGEANMGKERRKEKGEIDA